MLPPNVMNSSLRILLLVISLGFGASVYATDVVTIYPKFKQDALAAPDPEYPQKSQHLGYQGQSIYRLIINEQTGMADEVKVLKTTGYRELDASAVLTLFKWKFKPGAVKQRNILIIFQLTGWVRGLH